MIGNTANAYANLLSNPCNFFTVFLEYLKVMLNWPAVVLILVLIFIMCFKTAINNFIDRIKRVKGDKGGIDIETTEEAKPIEIKKEAEKEIFNKNEIRKVGFRHRGGAFFSKYIIAEKNIIKFLELELDVLEMMSHRKVFSSSNTSMLFDGIAKLKNNSEIAIEVIYPRNGIINNFVKEKIKAQSQFAFVHGMRYILAIAYENISHLKQSICEVHSVLRNSNNPYEIRTYNIINIENIIK